MPSPFSNRLNKESCDVGERRQEERYAPSFDMAVIWVAVDQRVKARVVDECDDGIGLRVPLGVPLEVSFQVRVEHSGARRSATIRHVAENDQGCLTVGLSWDD